jgi:hypothetical protein
LQFPSEITAFVSDRFGLRNAMLWLDGRFRYEFFGESASDQVVFGLHKRIFLTSHVKGYPFSLIDTICGVGIPDARIGGAALDMARLLDNAASIAPRSFYVSVPTAPALYPEDLPLWIKTRCDKFRPAAPAVRDALEAIRPDLKGRMVYAIQPMLAAKAVGEAIPRDGFHWYGLGSRMVSESVAETTLGMTQTRHLPVQPLADLSDLAQFMPGLTFISHGIQPDYGPAGIIPCYGVACAPDLTPFGHALTEVSRFRWTSGTGPRLLLISDSFGARAAGWFGEYFADVIHLNINLALLSPEQRSALRAVLVRSFHPDVLIMLFHDGAVLATEPQLGILFEH